MNKKEREKLYRRCDQLLKKFEIGNEFSDEEFLALIKTQDEKEKEEIKWMNKMDE